MQFLKVLFTLLLSFRVIMVVVAFTLAIFIFFIVTDADFMVTVSHKIKAVMNLKGEDSVSWVTDFITKIKASIGEE